MKRSVKRNVSAVSMAALGTVTIGGMLMATAGTAFAATPTPTIGIGLATGATVTNVYAGTNNQAAGSVTITINNQFAANDVIDVPILPNGAANVGTAAQAVYYSGAPTVTVSSNTTAETTDGDTAPVVTSSLATNPADSNAVKNAGYADELVLKFSNSFTGTTAGNPYTITLSGINYNVGSAASTVAPGTTPLPVSAGASYVPANTATAAPAAVSVVNAQIPNYQLTEAPTGVPAGATAAPIANLTLKEVTPGTFPASTANAYSISVPVGSGTLAGTATITATGFTIATYTAGATTPCGTPGTSIQVAADTNGKYTFCVVTTTNTTTGAGSLVVSNMAVTPTVGGGSTIPVTVTPAAGATTYTTPNPAVTVVTVPAAVSGYTADDTAAQAALSAAATDKTAGRTVGAVVLASDAEYQDALAASYLIHATLPAQDATGTSIAGGSTSNPVVLNPYDTTNESATAAAQVIRKLGVGTVYIIGGTMAISQDVQNQLAKIQVGTVNNQPVYLQVIRIAGQTAEQTAAMVAGYPLSTAGTLPATPGAYGMYNSGNSESTTPTAAAAAGNPTTAILVDADEFQDALSAAPIASRYNLPVLLNAGGQGLDTSASAALANLHVQQVIVVGGSAAVSDQAVQSLQAAGYSVLRIAGPTFDATSNLLAQFEVNSFTTPVTNVTGTRDGLNAAGAVPATTKSFQVGTSRGDAYQDALASAQVLGSTTSLSPLLLNTNTSTISTGAGNFLSQHGPNAKFQVYTDGTTTGNPGTVQIYQDQVFGGSLAQTPALIQSELNSIAGA